MADRTQNSAELVSSKEGSKNSDEKSNLENEIIENGKNGKQIKCQRCPSTILIPGTATLVEHEFKLPEAPTKEDETKEVDASTNKYKYWCVDNMYAFENVGFSKTVEGVKYLICADCEIGPIGWHDLETKLSYVSLGKVNYC
ncbi:guanine nucleotide exchange factor MSS4 [Parasteatoda tepidariorum]|uniref:guanine nucleotide exchange factor MSS4 n=1 Tax=Parasteatoda tepidariorum TaxID=114398 RepID=UPI00077FDD51|nr:guanine nucleotide exchange factor MSS4 [Parasteatoda tepidariorum]